MNQYKRAQRTANNAPHITKRKDEHIACDKLYNTQTSSQQPTRNEQRTMNHVVRIALYWFFLACVMLLCIVALHACTGQQATTSFMPSGSNYDMSMPAAPAAPQTLQTDEPLPTASPTDSPSPEASATAEPTPTSSPTATP